MHLFLSVIEVALPPYLSHQSSPDGLILSLEMDGTGTAAGLMERAALVSGTPLAFFLIDHGSGTASASTERAAVVFSAQSASLEISVEVTDLIFVSQVQQTRLWNLRMIHSRLFPDLSKSIYNFIIITRQCMFINHFKFLCLFFHHEKNLCIHLFSVKNFS